VVGKEALGLVTFEDGAFGTYMALPPVIPICTWPEITKLMDEAPAREEFETAMLPTQRERERYSPWMTDEQKELILTIAKNPEFHVTEAEAARFTSDEFVDWPSVIKAAIANKGYKNEAAVRAAMKKVYSQGMGFAKTYDLIPPA